MRRAGGLCSLLMCLVGLIGLELIWTEQAQAIPAWARKYDQPCALCHYPAVPRLNTFGHKFRQAGYRMADEFNKDIQPANTSHYLAARGRGRFTYTNFEAETKQDINEFSWHDTTLFYAGPVGRNFAAFNELEWEAEDDIGLTASIQGVWGNPDRFTTLRVGQFHTRSSVGFAGFDRPTGISVPSIRSANLTKDVEFTLGADQRGLEVAHVFQLPIFPERSRLSAQVTNGVNEKGKGTGKEIDAQKDYSLVLEQILDDRASGLTLLYYGGTYHKTTTLTTANRIEFQRYGGTFAWILPVGFEIQGGYIRSTDEPKADGAQRVNGNAFYVELEQYIAPVELTALTRYDVVDLNDDSAAGDDQTAIVTVGLVKSLQDSLRLAVEGSATTKGMAISGATGRTTDNKIVAELMIAF